MVRRSAFLATAFMYLISVCSAAGGGSPLPEVMAYRQTCVHAHGQQWQGGLSPPESITSPFFEHYQPILDSFARRLKEEADAELFVYVYGGRVGHRGTWIRG